MQIVGTVSGKEAQHEGREPPFQNTVGPCSLTFSSGRTNFVCVSSVSFTACAICNHENPQNVSIRDSVGNCQAIPSSSLDLDLAFPRTALHLNRETLPDWTNNNSSRYLRHSPCNDRLGNGALMQIMNGLLKIFDRVSFAESVDREMALLVQLHEFWNELDAGSSAAESIA